MGANVEDVLETTELIVSRGTIVAVPQLASRTTFATGDGDASGGAGAFGEDNKALFRREQVRKLLARAYAGSGVIHLLTETSAPTRFSAFSQGNLGLESATGRQPESDRRRT